MGLCFPYPIVTIQSKAIFWKQAVFSPPSTQGKKSSAIISCCKFEVNPYSKSRAKSWKWSSSIRANFSTKFRSPKLPEQSRTELVQSRFGPEAWGNVNFQNPEALRTELPNSCSSLMRNGWCISLHTKGILHSLTSLQLYDWKKHDREEAKSPDWNTARNIPPLSVKMRDRIGFQPI